MTHNDEEPSPSAGVAESLHALCDTSREKTSECSSDNRSRVKQSRTLGKLFGLPSASI